MSKNKFETVSSLVDNYQQDNEHVDELFDEINASSQLSDTWSNYQLIGDAIRNELPKNIQLDLSDKIAMAIADEPSILAPKKTASSQATFKAKIVQWVKPFGQIAIAASAAGLMILGVQQNVADNETILPSQVVQTIPLAGIADPVSFNYQPTNQTSKKQVYIEQQRRFQALLADHQQQIKFNYIVDEKMDNEENLSSEKVEDSPK